MRDLADIINQKFPGKVRMAIPENSHVRMKDGFAHGMGWESYGVVMETRTTNGELIPELLIEHLDGSQSVYFEDEFEVCSFHAYLVAREAYRKAKEAQARRESDASFDEATGQSRN